jgi:CheY-like chemotaxis protein
VLAFGTESLRKRRKNLKNARIFIAEDNVLFRKSLKDLLKSYGHCVVLEAGTLDQALQMIQDGCLQQQQINLAILDGNLREETSCSDGFLMSQKIKETRLPIKIFSLSSSQKAIYGDFQVDKINTSEIIGIIANL